MHDIGVILGLYRGNIGVALGLHRGKFWGYVGVILGLYGGYIAAPKWNWHASLRGILRSFWTCEL